ncbi:hypothetical protein [Flexivirga oryzae]|uniref:Uncharacterized protein n=1 Tax=Flexivirga oryzae TaxID=1794944 RepID=A0A839N5I9_9MICO|nr:hypothetical protein [Flexivirga oryzae]MBB2893010.1 hypothetical protein [Flexivirga oryzae]
MLGTLANRTFARWGAAAGTVMAAFAIWTPNEYASWRGLPNQAIGIVSTYALFVFLGIAAGTALDARLVTPRGMATRAELWAQVRAHTTAVTAASLWGIAAYLLLVAVSLVQCARQATPVMPSLTLLGMPCAATFAFAAAGRAAGLLLRLPFALPLVVTVGFFGALVAGNSDGTYLSQFSTLNNNYYDTMFAPRASTLAWELGMYLAVAAAIVIVLSLWRATGLAVRARRAGIVVVTVAVILAVGSGVFVNPDRSYTAGVDALNSACRSSGTVTVCGPAGYARQLPDIADALNKARSGSPAGVIPATVLTNATSDPPQISSVHGHATKGALWISADPPWPDPYENVSWALAAHRLCGNPDTSTYQAQLETRSVTMTRYLHELRDGTRTGTINWTAWTRQSQC